MRFIDVLWRATLILHRILANANGCSALGAGRWPSFVLLDFVNLGDAFSAGDVMNGFA